LKICNDIIADGGEEFLWDAWAMGASYPERPRIRKWPSGLL